MGIAAAVIARLAKKNLRNNTAYLIFEDNAKPQTNNCFLESNWLKKHSPLILPHVDKTLLEAIYTQINKFSEKKLNEPELKKVYLLLIQSLALYQSKAEAILFEKNNLKSEALFFTFVFALPVLICICISIFIPVLPITLLSFLFFTSFIGKTVYSINELHKKHPKNETLLHYHFKNFINTLEKYKNDKPNVLTPHCVSSQSSEISLAHINKENNSNASNLNSNTLFFKSTKENNANPTVTQPLNQLLVEG